MTLIAYANKALYADSLALIENDDDLLVKIPQKKLHVSKNNLFAYVTGGSVLTKEECNCIEVILTYAFRINAIKKESATVRLKELADRVLSRGDRRLIVMTANSIFQVGEDGAVLFKTDLSHFSCGSGSNLFQFGYQLIKGPKTINKVRKLYSDISKVSRLSGELTHFVKMSQLTKIKQSKVNTK